MDTRMDLTEFLPDPARAANPWAQIWLDLTAPAPRSEWARRVTAIWIHDYTQIRAFLSRGFLLVVLVVLIAYLDRLTPLVWGLLAVGAVQTVLEIYLDFQLADVERRGARPADAVTRTLVRQIDWQWERTVLNTTGVLGTVAVVANLVCVLYLTGPDPGWVKLLALVVAVLYGNSGILAVLTDATFYSYHQVFGDHAATRPIPALRTHAWLVGTVILTAMVVVSIRLDRWAPEAVPLALAACVLVPYAIGMKMRDYDRLLRASGQVAEQAMNEARARMAHDFHDMMNEFRSLKRAVERDGSIDAAYVVAITDLAQKLTLAKEMADERTWITQGRTITLEGSVDQLSRDYSLRLTSDLRLDDLNRDNHEQARQLINTTVINTGQALARLGHQDRDVSVTGHVVDGMLVVSVRDPLPLVPESVWCAEGSTMAVLRDRLRDRGGDLVQVACEDGKEIRGTWPRKRPPIKRRAAK